MNTAQDIVVTGASCDDWFHWDQWLGLGEHLVPVVADPDAPIAPTSKLKQLGKAVTTYGSDGLVRGIADWTTMRATPEQRLRWAFDERLNLGVQCRAVRAIDVDIENPVLAGVVADLIGQVTEVLFEHDAALAKLGIDINRLSQAGADPMRSELVSAFAARVAEQGIGLPKRTRPNSPKFVVAFQLDGHYPKRTITTAAGKIEFLGDGQMFVAAGLHPSGAEYEWRCGKLDKPAYIPRLTPGQFEVLWSALVECFAVEPVKPAREHVEGAPGGEVLTEITAEQLEHLKSALAHPALLEAAGDNGVWSAAGYALLSLGELGRELFGEFSRAAANYKAGDEERWWAAHSNAEPRSDYRHIFNLASRLGWQNPLAAGRVARVDEFDVVEDAAPRDGDARFRFVPAEEFAAGEPLAWLVEGVLPQAELVVVYGASGSGKTFWTLDLICSIARGVTWRGRRVQPGQALYVCAEGVGGFRQRLKGYSQATGVKLKDLPLRVLAGAPNLLEGSQAVEVAKAAVAVGGARVIVVDTLAATMAGGNENSGEDVGKVISHCKSLHRATGATVILVHHSGKDEAKGARGWSGLRAAADAEIEITRIGETRVATVTKMKDGEDGERFAFKLAPVMVGLDEDGEPIMSCVVEQVEELPERARKGTQLSGLQKLIYELACDLAPLNGERREGDVEALVSAVCERRTGETKKSNVERSLNRLAESGTHIELLDDGRRYRVL